MTCFPLLRAEKIRGGHHYVIEVSKVIWFYLQNAWRYEIFRATEIVGGKKRIRYEESFCAINIRPTFRSICERTNMLVPAFYSELLPLRYLQWKFQFTRNRSLSNTIVLLTKQQQNTILNIIHLKTSLNEVCSHWTLAIKRKKHIPC